MAGVDQVPATALLRHQLGAVQRCLARIGAAWGIAGPHSLIFGLAANVTFPSRGLVVEPSVGYSAAF